MADRDRAGGFEAAEQGTAAGRGSCMTFVRRQIDGVDNVDERLLNLHPQLIGASFDAVRLFRQACPGLAVAFACI